MKTPYTAFFLIILFFVLDVVSKILVVHFLEVGSSISVLSFLNIVHVENSGIAFGLFGTSSFLFKRILLSSVNIIVFIIVIVMLLRRKVSSSVSFGLSLLGAGALGNLRERLFSGYVTDFIDLHIGVHHYPAFNIADACITTGILILIIRRFSRKSI